MNQQLRHNLRRRMAALVLALAACTATLAAAAPVAAPAANADSTLTAHPQAAVAVDAEGAQIANLQYKTGGGGREPTLLTENDASRLLAVAAAAAAGAALAALVAAAAGIAVARRWRRRAAALRSELDALTEANSRSERRAAALDEANATCQHYLSRFMWLSLGYIGQMEDYRKTLNRVAARRNFDELFETIKATRHVDKQVASFYDCFDEAFLRIHPTFVADINRLLRPDAQVALKSGEKMNTELRLFALLKLGIDDSQRLQEFLRCSPSTIYNYRTNMRNRALRRDSFERDVAAL